MSLTGSFVVFVILWWLILFTILPRDINSQKDKDFFVEGADPGAPKNPKIIKNIIAPKKVAESLDKIFLPYLEIKPTKAKLPHVQINKLCKLIK